MIRCSNIFTVLRRAAIVRTYSAALAFPARSTADATLRLWVTFRRRASLPAATGAPQKPPAVAGDHGFRLGPGADAAMIKESAGTRIHYALHVMKGTLPGGQGDLP
jgi:hypothetical protein